MKTIVVGIGNPILRDDSVGVRVVEELQKVMDIDTAISPTTGFEILDIILGYDRAIIVDAISTGGEPGTIYELSVDDLDTTPLLNTHSIPLAITIKLGYTIFGDRMPKDIKIFAIEAEDLGIGDSCSSKVGNAIPKVVKKIMDEIK